MTGYSIPLKIFITTSIIFAIETTPQLSEGNKKALEDLLNKEIPLPSKDKLDELELVYNYHLKKLLEGLDSIKGLLSNFQNIR